ncbi:MAG TPA: hypothetical protein VGZ92_04660 [Bradyrhizobium sp.]|jgi:hypothetical protein|nr:hypothetical protein [Bradyrhizobium sp.]
MERRLSAIGNDTIDCSFHMPATFVAYRQMPRSLSWLALAAGSERRGAQVYRGKSSRICGFRAR